MLTDEGGEHYSFGELRLEVVSEIRECGQFDEILLRGGRLDDDLVFEHPGEIVRDEDSVESGRERRVYVGLRTVAYHPGFSGVAGVMTGDGEVGFAVLFGQNFNRREIRSKAGASKLVGLLDGVALGDEDEAMPRGKIRESGVDGREEFDLVLRDALGEA